MNESSNDRIHELLCALLLGEVTPDERAEVENALARSAELRAEKARLEATIGVVRGAYAGDERLSDASFSGLVESALASRVDARPPVGRVWWRSPSLRAAAAVIALAGSTLGVLNLLEYRSASEERVATLSGKTAGGRDAGRAHFEAEKALEGLGYAGSDSTRQDKPSAPVSAPKDEASRALASESGSAREQAPELLSQLGYEGGTATGSDSEAGAKAPIAFDQTIHEVPEKEVVPYPLNRSLSLEDGTYSTFRDARLQQAPNVRKLDELWAAGGGGEGGENVSSENFPLDSSTLSSTPTGGASIGVSKKPAVGAYAAGRDLSSGQAGGGGTYRGAGDTVPGLVSTRGVSPTEGKRAAAGRMKQMGYTDSDNASTGAPAPSSPGPTGGGAQPHSVDRFVGYDAQESLDRVLKTELFYDGGAAAESLGAESLGFADDLPAGELDQRIDQWRANLSPEDRARLAERCSEIVISKCRRLPNERPRDMYFRYWGDNPFELAQIDRLSTFAADVDTASYALARNYLNQGFLPEKAQVRTEEFVNYFAPDLAPPTEDAFAITTELAPSLFGGREDRWILRVGIRAREVSRQERKPLVLTFVVDTSGSMQEQGRLELVKHAMRLLLGELDARDKIGVVAFSSDARLILPVTSVSARGLIESAIHPLAPQGSTNAEAGLRMGYELALGALDREAVNRVILLSDGVANTGQTDQDRISEAVRLHREKGIYLNTIGVGMHNHNDALLEQLADKGDGICDYVDSTESARRAIVDRFTGAFEPVASDVKIQVEFDPAQVYRWRQLGYENRAVADQDFRNDAIDAGEIGSGHQVVALYEIERMSAAPGVSPLTAAESPLATVRLRWKAPKAPGQDPREVDVQEREAKLLASQALGAYDSASYGFRRAVLAAQFAEFLRRSTHTESDRYSELAAACQRLAGERADAETRELASLVDRAANLILSAHQGRFEHLSELDSKLDELRRLQILRAEFECLEQGAESREALREETRRELENVRQHSEALERELREIIRRRVCEGRG